MFRFTIRDVLWLTVVVAMGVGWWIDKSRTAKARDEAIKDAKDLLLQIAPFPPTLTNKDHARYFDRYFPGTYRDGQYQTQ
jgi:hypothetical protein